MKNSFLVVLGVKKYKCTRIEENINRHLENKLNSIKLVVILLLLTNIWWIMINTSKRNRKYNLVINQYLI